MALQRPIVINALNFPELADQREQTLLNDLYCEVNKNTGYPEKIKRTYADVVKSLNVIEEEEKKEEEESSLERFLKLNPQARIIDNVCVEKNHWQSNEDFLETRDTNIELPPHEFLLHKKTYDI
jgi:hypothetical protein